MSRRGPRILLALKPPAWAGILVLAALACSCALAPASASARSLHFDGRQVAAPDSWPVYRLSEHPQMCVRLDRRAVYLGRPGANQDCPAEAIGRRRAILLEPRRGAR